MKKDRNSSIELLRIISMSMIILLHFLGGTGYIGIIAEGTKNYYLTNILESIAIVGVNIFVLISSYFLINSNKVKLRKVIDLLFITAFYGLACFTVAVIFNIKPFSRKELIFSVIPFLASRRWFVISYVFLYLISPYLSKLLTSLTKKSYQILLAIMTLFLSVWPTFLPGGLRLDHGYGIITFTYLFTIAGYLKLHANFKLKHNYYYLLIYLVSTILTFIMSLSPLPNGWDYNSIFNIIGAVSLFLFFYNINIKSKIINKISTHNFGIFLLHSDFMLGDFFYSIMRRTEMMYTEYFVIYVLTCVVASYIVCLIVDIFRSNLFKYTVDKILDKIRPANYEIKV